MVPKLKHPEFIEIGHISYCEYPNLDFDVKNFFIKYLPIARPKLVPKWIMLRIYWDLIKIIDKTYFWY